jgi:hypothetical protein
VKVGVVATVQIAMLAGLGAVYLASKDRSSWITGSALAFMCLAVVAVFCGAMALVPRVKGLKTSLLFFGRVAAMRAEDYAATGAAQIWRVTNRPPRKSIEARIR